MTVHVTGRSKISLRLRLARPLFVLASWVAGLGRVTMIEDKRERHPFQEILPLYSDSPIEEKEYFDKEIAHNGIIPGSSILVGPDYCGDPMVVVLAKGSNDGI